MTIFKNYSSCDIKELSFSDFPNCELNEKDNVDLSNISFINDIWYVVPVEQVLIKVSLMLPVVLWGVFGNVCLLYIIIKNRHLRSPTNYLIANMAFADFIVLSIHSPFFLARDFFQNYMFGAFGCHFEGGFECTVLSASVMSLVAISYDRLNSIALPQEKRLTVQHAKAIIFIVWIIAILFCTPLFVFRSYRERQWYNFLERYCTEDLIITNIYWHIVIIIIVWIPLGTMLVCYITLFLKLKQYEQVVLRKMKTLNVQYKKKVAKMMFVVVAVFVICRFPLTILVFYRNQLLKQNNLEETSSVKNQVHGAYYIIWFTSRYLIFLNAAINPVIYGLTSEKFRKAFGNTTVSKFMFAFNAKNQVHVKKKQNTISSNNKNIFFIFRNKIQKTNVPINETVITNSDSQAPIIR